MSNGKAQVGYCGGNGRNHRHPKEDLHEALEDYEAFLELAGFDIEVMRVRGRLCGYLLGGDQAVFDYLATHPWSGPPTGAGTMTDTLHAGHDVLEVDADPVTGVFVVPEGMCGAWSPRVCIPPQHDHLSVVCSRKTGHAGRHRYITGATDFDLSFEWDDQ